MRPNLSLENIAGALAVLGTGVIMAACGGDKPAVNANEVNNAAAPADGAGHCGADKTHAAGQASCSAGVTGGGADAKQADPAVKPADATPAVATPATTATPATPAVATPATPTPASTSKKPAVPATPAKKGGSGSCGAGTCGAKK
jgi:hypothetical protein